MNTVKVKKEDLLTTLQSNREKHRQIFLEAQDGYRKAVVAELEKMLAEARDGRKIRRQVTLIEPVDQTRDYDRAIRMLEMSQDDIVNLSEQDFMQYVMDDWSWKRQFMHSNAVYSATASGMMLDDEDDD